MSKIKKYSFMRTLPFVVDQNSLVRTLGRQMNFAGLSDRFKSGAGAVVVGVAGAAVDATAVPVAALTAMIYAGTILRFGAKKFAKLTADAAVGATTLTVEPLAVALVSNDTAYGGGVGLKSVPAGTVVVELSSGQIMPRAERPGSENAFGILETDADEDSTSDAVTGYGVLRAGSFWENFLPDATGNPKLLPSAYKTELRAQGGQFIFDQYADSRAS